MLAVSGNCPPCICCDEPMADFHVGTPQVCGDCWDGLSGVERAARWEAAAQTRLLQEIGIQLEHHRSHASEIARLAKAVENMTRLTKPLCDELDDVAGMAKATLANWDRVARQELDDDDEPWRESL